MCVKLELWTWEISVFHHVYVVYSTPVSHVTADESCLPSPPTKVDRWTPEVILQQMYTLRSTRRSVSPLLKTETGCQNSRGSPAQLIMTLWKPITTKAGGNCIYSNRPVSCSKTQRCVLQMVLPLFKIACIFRGFGPPFEGDKSPNHGNEQQHI